MQKQMSSKKIGMILGVAAAVVAVAVVLLIVNGKDEAFRSIMVYELEGSAVIERADIGAIDAAENLYLESGDRVSVQPESMMRMKLDDDKYITAEADTVFSLEAEGDGQDSKTRIRLEQGAVTNEIQKPLSGESLYETSTPNSVMAVRGTIYRAQLYDDGAGGQNMRLCCFDGTVAATPILPDGTFGEEVLVHAGSELTIYCDGTVDGPSDIDFTTLPEQAWQILSELLENGAPVTGITSEELARIEQDAAKAASGQSGTANQTEDMQTDIESEEKVAEDQNTEDQKTEDQSEQDQQVSVGKAAESKGKTTGSERKPEKKQSGDTTERGEKKLGTETGQKPAKPQDTPPAQSGTSDNSGTGNPDNGSGQGSDDGNAGENNGEKPDDNRDNRGDKPTKPEKKVTYTVTYEYQGSVFATQTVQKGKKTSAPVLSPAAAGAWDFDFNTKINADTTIEWKSGN